MLGLQVIAKPVLRADGAGDGGDDQLALAHAGQRHPEDAVRERLGELGSHLQGEPRLTAAPGPRQRQEPRPVAEQRCGLVELPPSPDQRARLGRQVRGVQRAQRRKLAVTELEERLGPGQVLEPVGA